MYPQHYLVATPVSGPLTVDQLALIRSTFRSVHQFQILDEFSIVYINEVRPLQLDRGAMESLVEYLSLAEPEPDRRRTSWLVRLAEKLTVRPKAEPEVLMAQARAHREEPDPYGLETPKFIARVRFSLLNGRRVDSTHAVDRLSDLDAILDGGPFDEDIRNIKIKLEIQR